MVQIALGGGSCGCIIWTSKLPEIGDTILLKKEMFEYIVSDFIASGLMNRTILITERWDDIALPKFGTIPNFAYRTI